MLNLMDDGVVVERWFTFKRDPSGDVEFLVRRIDERESLRIETDTFGKRIKFLANGGSAVDRRRSYELRIAKACAALRDSKNGALTVVDDETAAFYRRELHDESIRAGQQIVLDGRWTEAIKRRVLSVPPGNIAGFVLDKLTEMQAEADEEEEGKD